MKNALQGTKLIGADLFITKFTPAGDDLVFSTYLGGNDFDAAWGRIKLDLSGNIYIAGATESVDFALSNPLQGANAGSRDGFVSKISPTGNSLLYSTYLGGSSDDCLYDIEVDSTGNIYVVGETYSTDLILENPYKIADANTGNGEGFIAKINPSGDALLYYSYFGGSNWEAFWDLELDASGNIYAIGWTDSTDLPMQNPFQATYGGNDDSFIAKFSNTGETLLYSTYLGGADSDWIDEIKFDSDGNLIAIGNTYSTDFPLKYPYQSNLSGSSDFFILKMSSDGSELLYSTFFGGSLIDSSKSLAINDNDLLFILGQTSSTDFPTQNPYQANKSGGADAVVVVFDLSNKTSSVPVLVSPQDGATVISTAPELYARYSDSNAGDTGTTEYRVSSGSVADCLNDINIVASGSSAETTLNPQTTKFVVTPALTDGQSYNWCARNNDGTLTSDWTTMGGFGVNTDIGTGLVYSTYFGGTANDSGVDMVTDSYKNIYILGTTESTVFPTKYPYQSNRAGSQDIFVSKLSADGGSLIYSTYIGGAVSDVARGMVLDDLNNVYVIGITNGAGFPTQNAYQGSNAGSSDVVVFKLSSAGDQLIYSTFLGGTGNDYSSFGSLTIDNSRNLYVAGYTYSNNFPVVNAYQDTLKGAYNGFITKFSPSGGPLIYSTYLGGSLVDGVSGIALDASNNAYLIGWTESDDFQTVNPYQLIKNAEDDAFIAKLSSTGNNLLYSTYFGGDDDDYPKQILLDVDNNIYIGGNTESSDIPLANAYQNTHNGSTEIFITKFNASGDSLIYSTYFGGTAQDSFGKMTIDTTNNIYFTGWTNSTTTFPIYNQRDFPVSLLRGINEIM